MKGKSKSKRPKVSKRFNLKSILDRRIFKRIKLESTKGCEEQNDNSTVSSLMLSNFDVTAVNSHTTIVDE